MTGMVAVLALLLVLALQGSVEVLKKRIAVLEAKIEAIQQPSAISESPQ